MHDLVIRGGTIVDGSGAKPYVGDVAVDGGLITAVGVVETKGREEIDATGQIVTPGFVDIHTHYDGQATWDQEMGPSSNRSRQARAWQQECLFGELLLFQPRQRDLAPELVGHLAGADDEVPWYVPLAGIPTLRGMALLLHIGGILVLRECAHVCGH